MPNRYLPSIVLLLLAACNNSEAPVAAPTPPVAPSQTPPPSSPSPGATAAASAPAPVASVVEKKPVEEKTFTHSKLSFSFSYPASLTVKEEATGVTVVGDTLASTEDRSGRSNKPIPLQLAIRVTQQSGDVVKVAKRRIPVFGDSFPQGSVASFKESEGFAEKVVLGPLTGYRFTMGSHGTNEEVTFVPRDKNTLVITCSYVGDSLSPKLSESEQLDACHRVAETLKL